MNTSEFLEAPIKVEAKMSDGQLQPHSVVWQGRQYTVITVGRQWAAQDGTHILIEVHDGSRMEIQLGNDLNWRLLRYWPTTASV